MPYNYTQAEFDAFYTGNSVPGLPLAETYGLDYESARDATPRWYGVSFGNGNDGVSHMWPDYYMRTADPWTLAGAAMIGRMGTNHEIEIDGEADYGISATIYNPPDDKEQDYDSESWSSVNGAWIICDVFPIDDMEEERSEAPRYDSLAECFDEATLIAARSL